MKLNKTFGRIATTLVATAMLASLAAPVYAEDGETSTTFPTIEIFACLQTDAFDSMVYNPTNQPDGDVSELLNYLDENAVQSRYIGVTPQDKVIALSTCAEAETNGRVVIFGRLDRMS